MESCRVLTGLTAPVLAYYSKLVVYEGPETTSVCLIAALLFVTAATVRFLNAAEQRDVSFQCYDLWMHPSGCRLLVPLVAGVRCLVDD